MDGTTVDQLEFACIEERARPKSFFRQFVDVVQVEGPVMKASWVAYALGISRQRVHQLVQQRRIARVRIGDRYFIPVAAVDAYLADERKNGRPVKEPTLREAYRAGFADLRAQKSR